MLIQADLHCHSLASSHAYSTVDEMAAAARRYGLKAFALTDHAMSMPDAPHEWHFHNLHVLPQKINGVTVLRGAEANIKSFEGDIDMTEFDLSNLQWVVASCHVPVIKPGTEKENTAAYVNAVKNNTAIDVIGHCTVFRYPVDFEAIAKACKEYGKFIELNESSFQYRRSTEENCIAMLRACKKYETEITVNTGDEAGTALCSGEEGFVHRRKRCNGDDRAASTGAAVTESLFCILSADAGRDPLSISFLRPEVFGIPDKPK